MHTKKLSYLKILKLMMKYLDFKKDINRFWKKWHSKFSKRSNVATSINGDCDDYGIAEIFCSSFSSVHFDFYADSPEFVKCLNKVNDHDLIQRNKMDNEYSGNNLFDIEDIEHSISLLAEMAGLVVQMHLVRKTLFTVILLY